jgi:hypothetical protein
MGMSQSCVASTNLNKGFEILFQHRHDIFEKRHTILLDSQANFAKSHDGSSLLPLEIGILLLQNGQEVQLDERFHVQSNEVRLVVMSKKWDQMQDRAADGGIAMIFMSQGQLAHMLEMLLHEFTSVAQEFGDDEKGSVHRRVDLRSLLKPDQ